MSQAPLILVVEASLTQAARTAFYLDKNGYRTMAAAGQARALEAAREHRPDLVVTELALPDGDGFSLCRELAGLSPPVPALFYSSQDDPGSLARRESLGAAGFVAKSEGEQGLTARIAAILAGARAEDAARAPAPGLTVLIADDNKVNLMLAEWTLTHAGHETATARCGEEAVALAQARRFDLILMDIQMPDIDGPQASRRIRTGSGPCAGAPILALTGHTCEELDRLGEDIFDGYIQKPFELAEFDRAAAKALAKRRS
ncbi:MAG: response regulator [Desulfovibrionaceae bacterium]|nr:response regulator [Desulfovibrionaceae bacterium]MBF0514616.1 response regulator [Desulfovibrionaceae bacterium]